MASLNALLQHLNSIKVPTSHDKIYKDECVVSFDTPESDSGLFISLTSFLGFGRDFVEIYYNKTKHAVYLHHQRTKTEIPLEQQGDIGGPEKKITRLAIGVEGGFDPNSSKQKYEYSDHYSIVVLPKFEVVSLTEPGVPDVVKSSVQAVLAAESALKVAELEAMTGTWDGEARIVTKHTTTLQQLNNNKKIPPTGWQCEKCDLTNNLWLNLTDGSILCGRKFFDGSGGNDHALHHYEETKHPLAVKLGTISKEGKADVFSYDEDDLVEDPNLAVHLAHFGINIAQMEKTEKSMAELELDLNQKMEWGTCTEAGSDLIPVFGPERTGLINLGNSCYLNSVMQVIFTLPDFIKRFVNEGEVLIEQNISQDPANHFNLQMAKLGFGLCSGKYSQPPPESSSEKEQKGISPLMFKTLIGRGHPDFSTKKQQDAQEFFLHLINTLDRNSRHQTNPADCFKFQVEDRFQCMASNKVKYTHRSEYTLPLPIPLEAAVNKEQVAQFEKEKADLEASGRKSDGVEVVRPHIKFFSCLETFLQPESVEQFYSTAINNKIVARKSTRLSTFPDYLVVHLKKFTLREDWVPIKLDVSVDMPDILDLSALRGTGLQPGEECLPDPVDVIPPPVLDEAIVAYLLDMGYPIEACKKAAYYTQNKGIEDAYNWIQQHCTDSDFASTFVPPGTQKSSDKFTFVPNEEGVAFIMDMGFTREQSIKALRATSNNLERAADWIFSHTAELDEPSSQEENKELPFRDGDSRYRLRAFITHMGTSTMVGHYVCHILKDGQWIIFNDNKVALSVNPPKDLGYLYLYERI